MIRRQFCLGPFQDAMIGLVCGKMAVGYSFHAATALVACDREVHLPHLRARCDWATLRKLTQPTEAGQLP